MSVLGTAFVGARWRLGDPLALWVGCLFSLDGYMTAFCQPDIRFFLSALPTALEVRGVQLVLAFARPSWRYHACPLACSCAIRLPSLILLLLHKFYFLSCFGGGILFAVGTIR